MARPGTNLALNSGMRHLLRSGLVVLALGSLSACGAEDDALSVHGSVELVRPNASYGFGFNQRVNLVDTDLATEESPTAGHCRFGHDEEGAQRLSLGLSRPGADGMGIESLTLRLDLSGEEEQRSADVRVRVSGEEFRGSCSVTLPYADADDGVAEVNLESCELRHDDMAATFKAELSYGGCAELN